jgi:hypothetical protein
LFLLTEVIKPASFPSPLNLLRSVYIRKMGVIIGSDRSWVFSASDVLYYT